MSKRAIDIFYRFLKVVSNVDALWDMAIEHKDCPR